MGVATGCGFKEIYRFPHTTHPYSSCICTFLQQHPYFFFNFVNIYIYQRNAPANSSKRSSLRLAPIIASEASFLVGRTGRTYVIRKCSKVEYDVMRI